MFKKSLLIIIIFSNFLFAHIILTQKEKDFIKNHPTITLGSDKEWAPYIIQNKDDKIVGYDASMLELINKISGANFILKLGKFSDIVKETKNRPIDGLIVAVKTEDFKKYYIFSKQYIFLEKIVFIIRDDFPEAISIINKSLDEIGKEKLNNLKNKWFKISIKKEFYYSLFWIIFGFVSILIILLLFRYRTISKYNQKIEQYLNMIDKNVLISSSDATGKITQVSDALCKLTGYTKDELIGKRHNIFRHKDMPKSAFKNMWDTLKSGKSWQGELKNLNKDGSYYWANITINPEYNQDKTLKGYSAIRQDITDKKMLEKLTITDTLTQIPNRRYLDEKYDMELQRAKRYETIFSIIIIDIDFFKDVNDTYGHQVGDDVLIQVTQIISQNIRNTDVLGRWGGEEFLIICSQTDIKQAEKLSLKIKDKIEYFDFPVIHSITCSFGVSQYNKGDEKIETFKRADTALYIAKNSGRNKVSIN